IGHLYESVENHDAGISAELRKAAQIYTALNSEGYVYAPDPQAGYSATSSQVDVLDYLQFPAETIDKKSGDCDDFVVLYSSLLEAAGVETGYIDIPGHVFMAFNSQLTSADALSMGLTEDDMILRNDEVWIPIETTLLGTGTFKQAWQEGISRYNVERRRGNFPELIPFRETHRVYRPVTHGPSSSIRTSVSASSLMAQVGEQSRTMAAELQGKAGSYLRNQYLVDPSNAVMANQYAQTLAEDGQLAQAKGVLMKVLSQEPDHATSLNNLGNIFFMEGDYGQAIALYLESIKFSGPDEHTAINICMAQMKLGDRVSAQTWYQRAVEINSDIVNIYPHLKTQFQ
ncbi:MAG: hypothetical protein KTR24_05775, partial [Saprospiraceae bacterium]|nr:hypothetical protein [Saprospiraceae bacterium]